VEHIVTEIVAMLPNMDQNEKESINIYKKRYQE